MEGAGPAAGRPDIALYKSGPPFELESAMLVACQLLSMAAPWSPHYRGMTKLAGLSSSEELKS